VVARGVSSAVTSPPLTGTGTSSASKAPLAMAFAARSWLCRPKASDARG
jgi:hypothetical protein